jgi:hypothetical protein
MIFTDKNLPVIWGKMDRGIRLDKDDGRVLFASPDLLGVGMDGRPGSTTAPWAPGDVCV